jgi:hypothetical protein
LYVAALLEREFAAGYKYKVNYDSVVPVPPVVGGLHG